MKETCLNILSFPFLKHNELFNQPLSAIVAAKCADVY